LYVVGNSDIHV